MVMLVYILGMWEYVLKLPSCLENIKGQAIDVPDVTTPFSGTHLVSCQDLTTAIACPLVSQGMRRLRATWAMIFPTQCI